MMKYYSCLAQASRIARLRNTRDPEVLTTGQGQFIIHRTESGEIEEVGCLLQLAILVPNLSPRID